MSISLHLRPKKSIQISTTSPTSNRFFSSSPSDPPSTNENTTNPEQEQPKSSFSAYFSDVRSSLKQQNQHHNQRPSWQSPPGRSPSFIPEKPPSKVSSLQEIQKNLSEFRRRTSAPETPSPDLQRPISFTELYKRNVIDKSNPSNAADSPRGGFSFGGGGGGGDGKFSLETIRESLRNFTPNNANVNRRTGGSSLPMSLFKDNLNRSQDNSNAKVWPTRVIGGGSDASSLPIFDKEKNDGESVTSRTEFLKMYTYDELGEKLRLLRPEKKAVEGENWFSLTELNERLVKLREMEKNQNHMVAGISFNYLRQSLSTISSSDAAKAKNATIQRLDLLTHLGKTPNFMLSPPKEELVEKYFHPDNMSSAEKMKIELEKVREEFKTSESDCGSARVQVAQLTTKIKHLSTVLHKKDKHSRKGLQEMVQKRKKLLKYLRRTDWESYCFVLEKLGLRDNPGYKMK